MSELNDLPTWAVVQAYHAVSRELYELFAGHGLTPVQFGVLAQLSAAPGLTQAELARRVLIRPQSMTAVITQLAERGLLERHGPGGRGRPLPVRATEAGRALLASAEADLRAASEPAALGLATYEAGMLTALLHKLVAARTTAP
ncbi:MarR family transcriptional regulator [Amycolatopsis sp. PS_44_ISF1]|uniref:MarR family winged helix-turn-helix transcriptional regulator n=1 Tax=Amycolatopsis sp. PS_44_ISF1 TaxID=2974917 RepID=UPI0028DE5EEE|nr:MarR family transcriptional regulator [Amycolatopsis sp. PS_44_ISF1]MDT8912426.1 MarR family transcriptional regulator [Amycolatopsis sp. PS_44_ISF1]